eukprot:8932360-Pyramimonas_sp.AAC.1
MVTGLEAAIKGPLTVHRKYAHSVRRVPRQSSHLSGKDPIANYPTTYVICKIRATRYQIATRSSPSSDEALHTTSNYWDSVAACLCRPPSPNRTAPSYVSSYFSLSQPPLLYTLCPFFQKGPSTVDINLIPFGIRYFEYSLAYSAHTLHRQSTSWLTDSSRLHGWLTVDSLVG